MTSIQQGLPTMETSPYWMDWGEADLAFLWCLSNDHTSQCDDWVAESICNTWIAILLSKQL